MNLKQLEAFVCVAEGKSFSAAAKKLYLTQPTVSAHISSLEKELGVRLFVRTTKDVELSREGELLYDNARRMLQLEKNILRDFTQKDSKTAIKSSWVLPQCPVSIFCLRFFPCFPEPIPEINWS